MDIIEYSGYFDLPGEFGEHFHTFCELMYIHEGCLDLTAAGETIRLEGGMLYIIPSCVRHSMRLVNKEVYRRTLVIINPWGYSRAQYSMPINNFLMGFGSAKVIAVMDDFGAREPFVPSYCLFQRINDAFASDTQLMFFPAR